MQKKKIDDLFQEKFSDFKEVPSNKVWRAIESSLDKKKSRRVFPIWWQLSGIAAVLAIGFFLFNPLMDSPPSKEILVDTKNDIENTTEAAIDSTAIHAVKKAEADPGALVESTAAKAAKATVTREASLAKEKVISSSHQSNVPSSENAAKNQHAITDTYSAEKNSSLKNTAPSKTIADKTHIPQQNLTQSTLVFLEDSTKTKIDPKQLEGKNALAANEAANEKKSIFDEIADQKEEELQEKAGAKWSAGPSIAPVYFNALGKGSPVNSIFVPNSKSGNINFSYGVSVAYEVSKKLTIRSGIHKVDYGYDTEDVTFSSSVNTISSNGRLASIDYAPTSNSLIISSKKVVSEKFSTANSAADVTAKSAAREGFMSQQLGYLELPVELNYALFDKKFGINLIGGVSSLFLVDNAVSLTAGELTTEIGEANNINELNFSANMGLGFHYKFSPKLRFNVEPIFKYQLNTFSEINGTFRPYSVGVYSGLNFRF